MEDLYETPASNADRFANLAVNVKTRTVPYSDKPGLGVDINQSVIKMHSFQQEFPRWVFHADGSVGDW